MIRELRKAFDGLWLAAEGRSWIHGRLGRPDGTISVADRPNFVYVRTGADDSQSVASARNAGRVPLQLNLPVKMRREEGVLVIHETDAGSAQYETGAGSGVVNDYGVPQHTHRIGTGLEYEVESLRLQPGRLSWGGGMMVDVNPFRYYHNGDWYTFDGGTLDLTANKPPTSGRWAWVLVGVDPATNTLVAETGSEELLATPLTFAMLDSITFPYIAMGAVKVRQADMTVGDTDDYIDAHGWFNLGGSGLDAEGVQDAIGGIFTATATITPVYTDATPAMTWNVNPASITAAMLVDGAALAEILDDDGAASGLDADLLDGQHAAAFSLAAHTHVAADVTNFDEAVDDRVGALFIDSTTLDVTYDDALGTLIADVKNSAITNAKLADMAQSTVKGRAAGAGTGAPVDLTAAQLVTILLAADGAGSLLDADLLDAQSGAYYLDRANHTSTQLAATISDFAEAVDDRVGVLIIDSATVDATYNDGAGTLSLAVIPGGIDHGALGGLTDDDHVGYLRLAGRAGGQTAYGGTAANEDLVFEGTAHATKTTSYVIFQPTAGFVGIGTVAPADTLSVGGGGLFLSNPTNDFVAIRMRPNDGNKVSRIQGVGDGNAVHSAIVFAQDLPTGAGAVTDGHLEFQTLDGSALATRVWILDNGNVGIGATPATRLNIVGTSAILRFGAAGEADSSTFTIDIATSGGSTNSGNGRTLLIKAGDTDNTAAKTGGYLYLRPGAPVAPATAYGDVVIADQGGITYIANDTDRYACIGRAQVGASATYSDYAYFGHLDQVAGGMYGMLQSATGDTFVNASNGRQLYLRHNNNTMLDVNVSGRTVGITSGNSVDAFRIDKAAAGNTSEVVERFVYSADWSLRLEEQHVTSSHIQWNWIERYNTVEYNAMTFRGGNVGMGTTAPKGKLHGHDGTGGFGFFTKTAIGATAQEIIPNAAGDVVTRGHAMYTGSSSGGNTFSGVISLANPADSDIYNDGFNTNVLKLRVNADGSVDIRRTAGALTYSASIWLIWQ